MLTLTGILLVSGLIAQDHPARFVWKDPEGEGRQQTVLFRRSFELTGPATRADLHLFADSRYHLYVNGTHIQFGPSRFYTGHPEYDTYDLLPYLQEGDNVVAVEVLTNGTVSFQVPLSIGGMIAWGEVVTGGRTISLKTPGNWRMQASGGFDHQALRFSFACGPMEIFDGRRQPADWNLARFDDSDWSDPVEIAGQDHWGRLTPRTIPFLTQDERIPLELLGIYRDRQEEELYTFFVKTPDETRQQYGTGYPMYACTHIYSPENQQVEAGLFWGEYFLNGKGPIPVSGAEPGNPVRQNRFLDLKKGWNFFFISYTVIWGGWDFYMAVPREAGLVLSPYRRMSGGPFMLTSGPHPEGAPFYDPGNSPPADGEAIMADERFGWEAMTDPEYGANPARELVWRRLDLENNLKTNDYQVSRLEAEEPRTFIFDMGGKQLGRIFVELEASRGAVVDLGWSEDLNSLGLPFLYKRYQVNSGARFISGNGFRRYETFKPYGVRYLQVRIDPGTRPACLVKTGVVEQVYPFRKKGWFECSNPMLDRIWELGWRTLRVCSEDSYTDTPFRERGLYAGDALPEYAITLATSGDSRLMKRSLMLFQDMYRANMIDGQQEGLNDFVLKTLVELDWYYRITGDREFLERLYPNYHSLMQHILQRRSEMGTFPTDRVFIEWTRIDKDADLTAYQALLAGSFRVMSDLAGKLGITEDSLLYLREADRLSEVINRFHWDEQKGLYRDGFREAEPIDHHYPISSVYPLLFGVVPADRKAEILELLEPELKDIGEETRNRKITPYGSFYLFSALYREGREDIAERFMVQYWSRMIHQGDDTSWENFDIGGERGGGQGTASHAWSGHPTFFLSTEVLGVQLGFTGPFDPGRIDIEPRSETLQWARGKVPHPAGMVGVDWRISGERLVVKVSVPEGVPCNVRPKGRLGELELDLEVKIEDPF